jgi:hypothetical protein
LIGRTEKGFDFLGYHFKPGMLSVAKKTVHNFLERITRLYEQGASIERIGQYVLKWYKWLFSGLAHFLKNILRRIRGENPPYF